MTEKNKNILINVSVVMLSMMFSLLATEAFLRFFYPTNIVDLGEEIPWIAKHQTTDLFTIDDTLGFRPILGSREYNKWGTRDINKPLVPKKPDKKRLLFIGDSVTVDGHIIENLKKLYTEDKFDYWNAGVGSYNTAQEIEYYFRYNQKVNPDHVILTFHLNDFDITPITFMHNNKIVGCSHNLPIKELNPLLLKNSHLYRRWAHLAITPSSKDENIKKDIRNSIKELKEELNKKGIKFTVLINPLLKPLGHWDYYDERIKSIRNILKELDVKYFDLTPVMLSAWKQGVKIHKKERDYDHPSWELGEVYAKYLYKNNIFETP